MFFFKYCLKVWNFIKECPRCTFSITHYLQRSLFRFGLH